MKLLVVQFESWRVHLVNKHTSPPVGVETTPTSGSGVWDTEQLLLSLREVNAKLHILEKSLPFCWSLAFCRRPSVSCVCSLTGATSSSVVNIKLVSQFVWRKHYLLEKKVNEMQMWVKWNTKTGESLTLKHDDDDTRRSRSIYKYIRAGVSLLLIHVMSVCAAETTRKCRSDAPRTELGINIVCNLCQGGYVLTCAGLFVGLSAGLQKNYWTGFNKNLAGGRVAAQRRPGSFLVYTGIKDTDPGIFFLLPLTFRDRAFSTFSFISQDAFYPDK